MRFLDACPGQDRIVDMLDGELSVEEIDEIAAHLESCSSCREQCDSIRRLAKGTDADSHNTADDLCDVPAKVKKRLKAVAVEAGDAVVGEFPFLRPPEKEGELGRIEDYIVHRVLGRGGMGVVFEATDSRLHRSVALKIMLPEQAAKKNAKARFLQEARAAAALEHDNIVAIYQVGEEAGVPYIAMPLLKGCTLERYLEKRREQPMHGMSIGQIVKIGREIARGLQAAHERGLTHRDIKPSNIWLDSSAGGRIKILDFGLVRPSGCDLNLTRPGAVLGTPEYMAPEQAGGNSTDGRADLFSLGVVLYRMCAGVSPFRSHDVMGTLYSLATYDPPPPSTVNPTIPTELNDLITCLLRKEPEKRIGSAKEVVQRLGAVPMDGSPNSPTERKLAEPSTPSVLAQSPASVSPPIAPRAAGHSQNPTPRPTRKWPIVMTSAAGFAAATVLLGVVVYLRTVSGALRVEIDDSAIEVNVKGTDIVLKNADRGRDIVLTPGEISFVVKRGDFSFETNTFLLKNGDRARVNVAVVDGKVALSEGKRVFDQRDLPRPPYAVAPIQKAADTLPLAQQSALKDLGKKGVSNPAVAKPEATPAGPLVEKTGEFAIRLSPLRIEGLPPRLVGDELRVAFDLSNHTGGILNVPVQVGHSSIGTVQAWIERLGDDPAIPPIPKTIAKRGRRYAAGGSITPTPAILPADFSRSLTKTVSTKNFPAGGYRYTVEFKPANANIGPEIQEQSIDFEVKADNSAPAKSAPVPPVPAAIPKIPAPILQYNGYQGVQNGDELFRKHYLIVKNFNEIPAAIFPGTTVKIEDKNGRHIYGFLNFNAPVDLTKIWFATQKGDPPTEVRIRLIHRDSEQSAESNVVVIPKE